MGGNAFTVLDPPIRPVRLKSAVYTQLRDLYITQLRSLYYSVGSPVEAPEKTSHGDIDILVSGPKPHLVSEAGSGSSSSPYSSPSRQSTRDTHSKNTTNTNTNNNDENTTTTTKPKPRDHPDTETPDAAATAAATTPKANIGKHIAALDRLLQSTAHIHQRGSPSVSFAMPLARPPRPTATTATTTGNTTAAKTATSSTKTSKTTPTVPPPPPLDSSANSTTSTSTTSTTTTPTPTPSPIDPTEYFQLDITLIASLPSPTTLTPSPSNPNNNLFAWNLLLNSYSDLWSILAISLRPLGLLANPSGFFLISSELEKDGKKRGRLLLTRDPDRVLRFAGLPRIEVACSSSVIATAASASTTGVVEGGRVGGSSGVGTGKGTGKAVGFAGVGGAASAGKAPAPGPPSAPRALVQPDRDRELMRGRRKLASVDELFDAISRSRFFDASRYEKFSRPADGSAGGTAGPADSSDRQRFSRPVFRRFVMEWVPRVLREQRGEDGDEDMEDDDEEDEEGKRAAAVADKKRKREMTPDGTVAWNLEAGRVFGVGVVGGADGASDEKKGAQSSGGGGGSNGAGATAATAAGNESGRDDELVDSQTRAARAKALRRQQICDEALRLFDKRAEWDAMHRAAAAAAGGSGKQGPPSSGFVMRNLDAEWSKGVRRETQEFWTGYSRAWMVNVGVVEVKTDVKGVHRYRFGGGEVK